MTDILQKLVEYEIMLNEYSGKRYHIISGDDWKFKITQIVNRLEIVIIDNLSGDEMLVWIKKHLLVDLVKVEA